MSRLLKVWPPSAENHTSTAAQDTGAAAVLATSQVTRRLLPGR
ncbi:hypothetical protein [Ideonella paludis]